MTDSGKRVTLLSEHRKRFGSQPMAAWCLWLVVLGGCATQVPDAPPPSTETAEPSWSRETAPDRPELATPPVPVPAPEPGFARADPERLDPALDAHRLALLEQGDLALSSQEQGYYLDTLEARLIQLLRGTGVRYQRSGARFSMQLAGGDSFATNTARLTDTAVAQLRPVIGVLVEYDRTRILVFGHSDDVGESAYNQALSARRAEAVARLLVDGGVDSRRILVSGFGESRPVADNTSEAGRALNRRVELVVEALAD